MIDRVGVVIPAHNEEALLPACVDSVAAAARELRSVDVHVVVVLDACTDRSESIALSYPWLTIVKIVARNVGLARASGVAEVLRASDPVDTGRVWLATTDADSVVPTDWLRQQIALANSGWEVVVGTVAVSDWSAHPPLVAHLWAEGYDDEENHLHVHGANFGCRADAYVDAGGWSALTLSEDVALLAAMSHRRVLRTSRIPVKTSARTDPRASGGFGDALRALAG